MGFIRRFIGSLVGLACIGLAASASAQTATPYGQVSYAGGVVASPSGDVFAVNFVDGVVFRVAPGGAATTPYTTGMGSGTYMLARAPDGTLYSGREYGNDIYRIPANCVAPCTPVRIATPSNPFGLTVDSAGNLYVGSFINASIQRYAAGCTAPCSPTSFATGLAGLGDLTFGPDGRLFAITNAGNVLAFDAGCVAPCTPTTYATTGGGSGWRSLTFGSDGSLYAVNAGAKTINRIPPGGGAGVLFGAYPEMNFPLQIDRNSSGTVLYVAAQNGVSGLFAVDVPPPEPQPVPTMTEWAMILFGMLLAGGAALHIQRRRQFA